MVYFEWDGRWFVKVYGFALPGWSKLYSFPTTMSMRLARFADMRGAGGFLA